MENGSLPRRDSVTFGVDLDQSDNPGIDLFNIYFAHLGDWYLLNDNFMGTQRKIWI